VFHDRLFDPQGKGFFDLFDLDGILGDTFTVNGKIQPFLRVARRKYRFRALNVGPSRFYEFSLSNRQPMIQLSRDGNLLPWPRTVGSVRLAVGDRSDLVVDFSGLPSGTELYLVNGMEQRDGRGPTGRTLPPRLRQKVLKLIVDGSLDTRGDPSRVPDRFFDLPPVDLAEVVTERTFVLGRTNGGWSINGKPSDPDVITASPRQGTAEIWTFVNDSGDWTHPMHVHMEEHQVLSFNGQAPPSEEAAREDVVWLGPGESVKTFRRFRDFLGRYVTHGQSAAHGDHGLMFQWMVVP
jgi:FtsP/CotA-like multicopper oxidase with cupredoxin domain